MALILSLLMVVVPQAHAFTLMATGLQPWETRDLQFRLNPQDCPASVAQAIDRALAIWNSVPTSSLRLSRGADSTQTPAELKARTATDVPLIVCDASFTASNWGTGVTASVVPAIGLIYGSNPIRGGGLALNVESGAGANVSNYDSERLAIFIAHEMGHVLGLGHSGESTALMYFNASSKQTLALGDDDVDGLTYLYGRDELFRGDPLFGACGSVSIDPGRYPGGPSPSTAPIAFMIALVFPIALALRTRRRVR